MEEKQAQCLDFKMEQKDKKKLEDMKKIICNETEKKAYENLLKKDKDKQLY
jgi:hypothetical protein